MTTFKRKYPTIGVLAGWPLYGTLHTDNFLHALLRGIRAGAKQLGCNLLIGCGVGLPMSAQAYRPAWPSVDPAVDFVPLGQDNTDGLIVVNPLMSKQRQAEIHALIQAKHPVFFVGTASGGPAIGVDNWQGIEQAVAHLAAHGHRRVAFIAGSPEDNNGDSGERLRAFLHWRTLYGLEVEEQLMAYGHHVFEGGQQAMRQLLTAGATFSAVLASNDESAIGALTVLQEAGWRVPQDVAVIGFDDHPSASIQEPPLTTVHCPTFERGYRAVEQLMAYLAGEKPYSTADFITAPAYLLVRQSCGCPAATEPPTVPAEKPLVQQLAEQVQQEVRQLNQTHVYRLCQQLVEAFEQASHTAVDTHWQSQLEQLIQETWQAEEDVALWQASLTLLEQHHPRPTLWQTHLFQQARQLLTQETRRQQRQLRLRETWLANQVGWLNASLLQATDEEQILEMLSQYLPPLEIEQAGLGWFWGNERDPVHWLSFQPILPAGLTPLTIESRHFPPAGLYQEPFQLAFFPLVVSPHAKGLVLFSTQRLELYDTLIRQLAAAFKSVQLYREATEGWRLAEQNSQLKTQFLSTISHELRTPLALIVGASQMLAAELTGKQEQVEWILKSAQHLNQLIQDVLDLAHSEVKPLSLNGEPVPLAALLENFMPIAQQLVRGKGLQWRVNVPPLLPTIWGDRTRLTQLLFNLVSNAVKFTPEGEVALEIEVEAQGVILKISDTGLGIPADEQALIFGEFQQSSRTAGQGFGGIGLGLAISKRLVELHQGEITVSSPGPSGRGTQFDIYLPLGSGLPALRPGSDERVVLLVEQTAGSGYQQLLHLGLAVAEVVVDEAGLWVERMRQIRPQTAVLELALALERGEEIAQQLSVEEGVAEMELVVYDHTHSRWLTLDYVGQTAAAGGSNGKAYHILLVDDEPRFLQLHTHFIQQRYPHYEVEGVNSGRVALDMVRQKLPDLLVLDLMMPEMDGFAVLEALQQDPQWRHLPVLVLTAQRLTLADMKRLNRGAVAVLEKGVFSTEETLNHIGAVLAQENRPGAETRRLVRQAMAYIHEHFAEPITRETVADQLGISKGHLSRCFQQELGLSPVTYLNRYRLAQAKKLLEEGGETITQIALAVGFSDSGYFSRLFRREVGVSPQMYQRSSGE